MGLNLNYTKEDGQQAFYWKVSRVENWFQGTTGPDYGSNINTLGFTNETYRDQGAPSLADNMFNCPYSGAVDYYEYALNKGSQAQAICIMALEDENKVCFYGVGTSQNTNRAAFDSILSSLNRKWSK